jgi:hypothetical protein
MEDAGFEKIAKLELARLFNSSSQRRQTLQSSAAKKLKNKRRFTVIAGVLALLSAGTVTGVMSKLIGDIQGQIIAIAMSVVSGTISLVLSAYFNDQDTELALTASSKYLQFRESVRKIMQGSEMVNRDALEKLQNEYVLLDEQFARVYIFTDGWKKSTLLPSAESFLDVKSWLKRHQIDGVSINGYKVSSDELHEEFLKKANSTEEINAHDAEQITKSGNASHRKEIHHQSVEDWDNVNIQRIELSICELNLLSLDLNDLLKTKKIQLPTHLYYLPASFLLTVKIATQSRSTVPIVLIIRDIDVIKSYLSEAVRSKKPNFEPCFDWFFSAKAHAFETKFPEIISYIRDNILITKNSYLAKAQRN